jgi:hypothetical protein
MSLHSILCFDSETVKILTFKGRGETVERATTINLGEFEAFLSADGSDDYQIIIDSPDTQYEIITIPPVEPKLIPRITQLEYQRQHPEHPPFTAFYQPIDEVTDDGKTFKRVACCMIPIDQMASVLEPFIRYNKSVSLITPLPTALAHLLAVIPETLQQTLLCVYDSGEQKCIFLLEKGCVTMVRHVPSAGAGWGELDIQNITMTLDYCFQALRVRPSRTIALNGKQEVQLPLPLTPFTPLGIIPLSHELQQEYLPHLAVMAFMGTSKEDLRPKSYLTALKHQGLLRKGTWFFFVGSLVVALLAFNALFSILSLKSELDTARKSEHTLPALLSSYHAVQQERSTAEPLVTAMNVLQSTPTLLELLASLPDFPRDTVRIDTLMTQKTGDIVSFNITGTLAEKSFAAQQGRFEEILASLAQLKGLTVTSQQLDQKMQVFTIEMKSNHE